MHQLEAAYNSYISAMEHSKVIKTNARRVFGAHLRSTRTELGMSVRELGDKIGVTGSLINQIEKSSKSILKRQHIQKIVDICLNAKNPSKPKADLRKEEESLSHLVKELKTETSNTAG